MGKRKSKRECSREIKRKKRVFLSKATWMMSRRIVVCSGGKTFNARIISSTQIQLTEDLSNDQS